MEEIDKNTNGVVSLECVLCCLMQIMQIRPVLRKQRGQTKKYPAYSGLFSLYLYSVLALSRKRNYQAGALVETNLSSERSRFVTDYSYNNLL